MKNEPAFPVTIKTRHPSSGHSGWDTEVAYPGISKREWFAGMALAGLCASGRDLATPERTAFLYADEMIAESQKPPTP